MNRRNFLKQSLIASAGTMFIPNIFKAFETLSPASLSGYKTMVVIQLSGGNDGLNTIVPFGHDEYYKKRNQIAIPQTSIIKLNDLQGFNPALQSLQSIYDQGWMAVINDVGYPNPNRSHFRSMDIWQSASNANQIITTGWLGRYMDNYCNGKGEAFAIEADDTLSLALKGKINKGLAIKDPQRFKQMVDSVIYKELVNIEKPHLDEDNLGYLYKTMLETSASAKYIKEKMKIYHSNATYPQGNFAKQLKTIADFINSGLSTKVYYVSLSGFDTHVNQNQRQNAQLKEYADGVSAFIQDLQKNDKFKDTLIMTFSEFGRRVEQNASGGTDHGTANNMFLYSGNLKKVGIVNAAPDLLNLDEGDLKYQLDFRQVYSTILNKWLNADANKILHQSFENLDFI